MGRHGDGWIINTCLTNGIHQELSRVQELAARANLARKPTVTSLHARSPPISRANIFHSHTHLRPGCILINSQLMRSEFIKMKHGQVYFSTRALQGGHNMPITSKRKCRTEFELCDLCDLKTQGHDPKMTPWGRYIPSFSQIAVTVFDLS